MKTLLHRCRTHCWSYSTSRAPSHSHSPAIAILPPPPTMTITPLPITTLEKSEGEGLIIRFSYNDATISPLFDLGYEITGYARGGGDFSHTATLRTLSGLFCLESRFIEHVSSWACVSINNDGKILNRSNSKKRPYMVIYCHNAIQKPFNFRKKYILLSWQLQRTII